MPSKMSDLSDELKSGALIYHSHPRPGKLEIVATKPLVNQRDLALAYSPGVAAACDAIAVLRQTTHVPRRGKPAIVTAPWENASG